MFLSFYLYIFSLIMVRHDYLIDVIRLIIFSRRANCKSVYLNFMNVFNPVEVKKMKFLFSSNGRGPV